MSTSAWEKAEDCGARNFMDSQRKETRGERVQKEVAWY
jgi:hypothetical protein